MQVDSQNRATVSPTYTLLMLTALSAMNQLDRQLVNILIEPIRKEFQLSDVQLGLLSGFAFVAIYSLMSVPAAMLAVRYNRRTLLACAAALWGCLTALSGYAQSYTQLLFARIGVGFGEAGGMPASHSIISDLYPKGRRATAMSTWAAGINVGIFFAFLLGGLIGQYWGWRWALICAGALTVTLAIVVQMTVTEPAREASGSLPANVMSGVLALETLRAIFRDRILRQITIGACLANIVSSASLAWLPSFLVRSHGMTIAEVGIYLAAVIGIGGAMGTWLSGAASDRASRRDIRWPLWFVVIALLMTKPFNFGFLLISDRQLALLTFILPAAFAGVYGGISLATLHDRIEPHLRPIASAIFLLLVNFIGIGVGPLAVGFMSDFVFKPFGPDALRYSLLVTQAFAIWAAFHFWRAGQALAPVRS